MITAISGKEHYSTEVSNGVETILADAIAEKGGSFDGFKPHELLCAGLAACMNITARIEMDHRHLCYDSVTVKVDIDKRMEDETVFLYDIYISGDLSAEEREAVLQKVARCPVQKSILNTVEIKRLH